MNTTTNDFNSLIELREQVAQRQGILTVSMKSLRDAAKVGDSLKVYVRKRISDELAKIGLLHSGSELPNNQYDMVRVYLSGSPISTIIEAASKVDDSDHFDEILRQSVKGGQTDLLDKLRVLEEEVALLDEIREMICS